MIFWHFWRLFVIFLVFSRVLKPIRACGLAGGKREKTDGKETFCAFGILCFCHISMFVWFVFGAIVAGFVVFLLAYCDRQFTLDSVATPVDIPLLG